MQGHLRVWPKKLAAVDTPPGYYAHEPKLKLTGWLLQRDGHPPVAGVIRYIYHTNCNGICETRRVATGWARRHGYLRGWVKTGHDGRYTFFTFRPAAYPGRSELAHMHAMLKEPALNPYHLDSFVFDDDPLITS